MTAKTKFRVDTDKPLHEQSYWHRLKPEVRREVRRLWEDADWNAKFDEMIKNGTVKIDPSIPKRNMIVSIPNDQLMKKEDLN